MEFPIYRKYNGIDVWFKILSPTHFIEYKKMGSKIIEHEVIAKIFPEKQFIQDLIHCHEQRWQKVTALDLNNYLSL